MLSKDSIIVIITTLIFVESSLIFYYNDHNVVWLGLIGGIGYVIGQVLITITDREEILTGRFSTELDLYESDSLENILFIQEYRKFTAMFGISFISSTNDNNFLNKIRLQNQFSIIHIEDNKGSIYLVPYEIELDQKWTSLSKDKQKYYLYQIYQHFINFNTVLEQLVIGVKTQLLTVADLLEILAFRSHSTIELDFDQEILNENYDSSAITEAQSKYVEESKKELFQEVLT